MPELKNQKLDAVLAGNEIRHGICIAFDYGTKRIGLAIGDARLKSARPLSTVRNQHGAVDWHAITALVDEWQPTALVVGWPLDENGEEQAIIAHVRGFINRLTTQYQLPVHKMDERFSSIAAAEAIREMRQSGQRKRKSTHADVDEVAAALILESWFAQYDIDQ
jgi:putative Holliday junction resolvase